MRGTEDGSNVMAIPSSAGQSHGTRRLCVLNRPVTTPSSKGAYLHQLHAEAEGADCCKLPEFGLRIDLGAGIPARRRLETHRNDAHSLPRFSTPFRDFWPGQVH
jgi:hypothetical protein